VAAACKNAIPTTVGTLTGSFCPYKYAANASSAGIFSGKYFLTVRKTLKSSLITNKIY